METAFYLAAAVAVASTLMMLTRLNPVHALLYLIISLLAVAVVFFTIGAPFIAALEVIIYAGAIMVLFIFVVMMLNLGPRVVAQEKEWLKPGIWRGPAILAGVLILEVAYLLAGRARRLEPAAADPKQIGIALLGPYLIGLELASMLLLAALVGAYHLGLKVETQEEKEAYGSDRARVAAGGNLVRAGTDRDPGSP